MTKNRSLLAKYDIPIEQLDFDFVGKCDDARRVERILLILRSGEEGFLSRIDEFRRRSLASVERKQQVIILRFIASEQLRSKVRQRNQSITSNSLNVFSYCFV